MVSQAAERQLRQVLIMTASKQIAPTSSRITAVSQTVALMKLQSLISHCKREIQLEI